MISHLHHINFIVRDIDSAIDRYKKSLGLTNFFVETLDKRGVITARVKLGQTWLILVQPTDPNSTPGQYLDKHGEGFFLLSFATNSIEESLQSFPQITEKRQGLQNWQVADFPADLFFGAQFQLTQEPAFTD